MITITLEEYNRLVASDNELNCLHQSGVDNWDYYDDAMDSYREQFGDT